MKQKIKIDVLMTIHNGEKYLEQATNSLKFQKFKNWNLIIINNYSTDKTSIILNNLKKSSKKIKIFNTVKLLSRPEVLNYGLRLCKNDYIGILDADDIASSNWLCDVEKIIKKNVNFCALIGNYTPIDEENKKLKKRGVFKIKYGVVNPIFNYTFPCAHSGSIFNKKILNQLKNPYDQNLITGHDWRLFLRISSLGDIFCVNKNWVLWRRYDASVTSINQIISKCDILRNLFYAKNNKLTFLITIKNNFMISIQIYHLLKLFISKRRITDFFYTLVILILLPSLWYKNNFIIKSFLEKINK